MKKSEIVVGGRYVMNHSSGRIIVKILREITREGYGHWAGNNRTMTHWQALNTHTGRTIEIKSAVKLLEFINQEKTPQGWDSV